MPVLVKLSNKPPVIGLTGGIASGKTTVAKLFVAAGAGHIDCDLLARKVVEPDRPELIQIAETFGSDMLLPDGNLNRPLMRERVFKHADDRKQLEAILHPAIREEIQLAIKRPGDEPYRLLDAPLLLEMGLQNFVQRVCVVDVSVEQQIQRLTLRDGIDEALARSMLAAQINRADRLQAANDIVDNTGKLTALPPQIQRLHEFYSTLHEAT